MGKSINKLLPKEFGKLFQKARSLDWAIGHESDNTFLFGKYSPAGQDFTISIDTAGDADQFLRNLKAAYENFDVSQEAYLAIKITPCGDVKEPPFQGVLLLPK